MIVTRREWGARYELGPRAPRPRDQVVMHHAVNPDILCGRPSSEMAAAMRSMERYHATDYPGVGRFAYQWAVFQGGQAYEGLGWPYIGAHVGGENTRSIGIVIVIDGDRRPPTPAAIETARELIEWGVQDNWIVRGYDLLGHRERAAKSCPGDIAYPILMRELGPTKARPILSRGSRGPAVMELQRRLRIGVDGIFGPATEIAVRSIQEGMGLGVDGVVGPNTWAALEGIE